jgi:hypothetical protein
MAVVNRDLGRVVQQAREELLEFLEKIDLGHAPTLVAGQC